MYYFCEKHYKPIRYRTAACLPPVSMGLSRQEYGSELPFPSLGNFPNPGMEPASSALKVFFSSSAEQLCKSTTVQFDNALKSV